MKLKTLKNPYIHRHFRLFTFLVLLGGYIVACTQSPHKSYQHQKNPYFSNSRDYEKSIKTFTQKREGYHGLYNTFQVWMTIMNSFVTDSLLRKRASFLKWNRETFHQESLKASQELSSESKITFSLFTPKNSFNDLNKGKKSIWKIYLEIEGERYIGRAKKIDFPSAEQQILFPHHSRFSSLYEVHFDVPMTKVEKNLVWVTLTSSLGSAKVSFPPSFSKPYE